MTINIDQSSSNRYRRLADSGIYDDFYPLRANACFHILDKTNNGTFNLQSFIENVKYISSYLSIYMDTSSDFAIMVSYYFININIIIYYYLLLFIIIIIILIIIIIIIYYYYYYYLYYLLYRVNFYH